MTTGTGRTARLISRAAHAYGQSAILVLNCVVLFVLLNVAVAGLYLVREGTRQVDRTSEECEAGPGGLFCESGAPLQNGSRTEYQLAWVDFHAYGADADPQFVSDVLDDFARLAQKGFTYQPWVQFAEPPFDGKYVHVDTDVRGLPIRRTIGPDGGELSDTIEVFVFGGSTTFGYNVADSETWPSYLWRELDLRLKQAGEQRGVSVVNYGRGYYEPGQELALFLHLLRTGARPDLAIFMDGVNWGTVADAPYLTRQFAERFEAAQFEAASGTRAALELLQATPVGRLAASIQRRFAGEILREVDESSAVRTSVPPAEEIAARFILNQKVTALVADLLGIETLFFLQPDASYNYPLELFRLVPPMTFMEFRAAKGAFYDRVRNHDGYVDLTDLFARWGHDRKAIVDDVHYSPAFNEFLAGQVAARIDFAKLGRGARE